MGKGMKKVFLHGALGKRFKKEWEFAVDSPSEVVSALFANEPKIEKYLIQKEKEGIQYGIKKQGKGSFVTPEDFQLNTNSDIHIFPIPKGSQTFIVNLAFMAATTYLGALVSREIAKALEQDDTTLQAQTKSYIYQGKENRFQQGTSVPLGYGRLKVGSNVVSSTVMNYDYNKEMGELLNFNSGLYSLIPEYSEYYISQLGPLGSALLLDSFDGSSKFSAISPEYQAMKRANVIDDFSFVKDTLYSKYKTIEEKKDEITKGAKKKGLLYYLVYEYDWFAGADKEKIPNRDGGNWYPSTNSTNDPSDFNYLVSGQYAENNSYVGIQSSPQKESDSSEKSFFPIVFAKASDQLNYIRPSFKDVNENGIYPITVGERWKNGQKEHGIGWFPLESASIYKSIDLISEGPIGGFCDKDGEKLKFDKNAETPSEINLRYRGDDYLQAVNLDNIPIKEILHKEKGEANAVDSYNINEFDIDIATNKDGDIGSNNQTLLEPQYLFTANTKEIGKVLYGPRSSSSTQLASREGSDFEKNKKYEKNQIVKDLQNDQKYIITKDLNNILDDKTFIVSNSIYCKSQTNTDVVDFYLSKEKFNNVKSFNTNEDYPQDEVVVQQKSDGSYYYKFLENSNIRFKGVFTEGQSYSIGDLGFSNNADTIIRKVNQNIASFSADDLLPQDDGSDPPISADPLYGDNPGQLTLPIDVLEGNGIVEKIDLSNPSSDLEYWSQLEINSPRVVKVDGVEDATLSRNIFRLYNASSETISNAIDLLEEYYLTHEVINPLVKEAYVSLQVDELAYIYEGDNVNVTLKIGPLVKLIIATITGVFVGQKVSKIAEAKQKAATAKAATATPTGGAVGAMMGMEAGAQESNALALGIMAGAMAGTISLLIADDAEFDVGTKNENSGETWPNRAKFRIKYGNEGEEMYSTDVYLYGVATSPYRKDVRIFFPPNPYNKKRKIKVYKLNRENNPVRDGEYAFRYKEKLSLGAVTEITPVKLNYPNSVVIGTRVNAKDVSSIPERTYDLRLKKVAIPSNYNPETKRYTSEAWNGLFIGQTSKTDKVPDGLKYWTDNPAWCLYDLLSDKRYGVGKFGIKPENIDRWTLYRIGRYCDEEVPTGYSPRFQKKKFEKAGEKLIKISDIEEDDFNQQFLHVGKKIALFYKNKQESIKIVSVNSANREIQLEIDPLEESGESAVSIDYPLVEPRYTLNAMIMSPQNAFKLINEFAQIFRAYAYWAGGAIHFFQDEKKDSVMLFANNNISNEGFVYSSTPKTNRVNSCKIQYFDKYNDFISKIECSEDTQSIRDNNIIEKKIDGFGVTSPGQAKRAADFLVKSANLETEIISFKTSSLGSYLRPGDIIDVVDNKRTIGRFAGKVLDITISGDGKAAEIDVDFPVRTIIDENDKSTWKNINLYTITGNQTIESLDLAGAVNESDIKNMRASQVGQYLASSISNNDTKIKIINNPYSFVTGNFSWVEALRDAEDRGGILATVNNDTDQSQVQAVLPSDQLGWIGGYNQELPSPEKFVWQQPQACNSDEITYFNWADGFPKVGSPIETDSEDNITTDVNDLNITTDSTGGYGNYIAVSGSQSSSIHGDWVTLSGNAGLGYVLEKKANNSLLRLNGIEGTTFSLEDSVNFAEPKTYRVININEESPGKFQIQGIEYDKNKFQNIENDASLQEPKTPVIFTEAKLDPPSSVTISVVESNGFYGLKADWSSVVGAVRYRVQFFNGNELLATFELENNSSQETQSFTYRGKDIIEGQNYYARIYPLVV